MKHAWKDEIHQQLLATHSAQAALRLSHDYATAFPEELLTNQSIAETVQDILKLETLTPEQPLNARILTTHTKNPSAATKLCLRLYQYANPIPLSDSVPLLENMGLRTHSDTTLAIKLSAQKTLWISNLLVTCKENCNLMPPETATLFCEALISTQAGITENDGLNRLVLLAGLSSREITLLRALTRYLQQIGFRFTHTYIENTLAAHPAITQLLVNLFLLRHGKKPSRLTIKETTKIESMLQAALDAVTSLDEDRILREFWQLIRASLRTNYFQTLPNGQPKSALAIKFESKAVPDLPLPHPLYEIFIYSTRFEGIHLRATKVARGGIRWSDRREDLRTEILGLMKAQRVKNSVIVPSGAKGGFVLKKLPSTANRAQTLEEGIACYQLFIKSLLDLTDNLKNNEIIPPKNVICHDEPDSYLVVAADKGTATFSDIANAISAEYDFWLGDAFASGGSAGYDHKKMGITARGAWESIKRHFREINIHLKETTISVVGIGDMSGDVFGNGMTYSSNIHLIAAFDHRHIFIDPTPNNELSFAERKRLFALPTSSWQDYNPALISKGGGVWPRSVKIIPISPEAKNCLGISADALTPTELIRAILQAPVDLLFNGGIGTYVKASTETHTEVGDRTNEFCRINGNELRCKVVGEGGNLGFTQRGRIEYALKGGLINTDFIDNSAGVDCSDHEVNIKILLNHQITSGKMTLDERNTLLASMTDAVATHVLKDNFDQALAMSFSAHHALHYTGLYQACMQHLEATIGLNRAVEFLPDDKKLMERKAIGESLTRPELAILLSYTKIFVKDEILRSDLPDDPWFFQILENAFPKVLSEKFSEAMKTHRLRREIISTKLSNQIVNTMGITFIFRLHTETGAAVADIVRAHTIASTIFQTNKLQKQLDTSDRQLPVKMQFDMLHYARQLLNLSTRWFLHSKRMQGNMKDIIMHYTSAVDMLRTDVHALMSGVTRNYADTIKNQFIAEGFSENLAAQIAALRVLYTTLNITEVATQNSFDIKRTARVYFDAGAQFGLVWFRDQIASDNREGHWNNMARLALRDMLDNLQRKLTMIILQYNKKEKNSAHLIQTFLTNHPTLELRWKKMLEQLHENANPEYTLFFVALQELNEMLDIGN